MQFSEVKNVSLSVIVVIKQLIGTKAVICFEVSALATL